MLSPAGVRGERDVDVSPSLRVVLGVHIALVERDGTDDLAFLVAPVDGGDALVGGVERVQGERVRMPSDADDVPLPITEERILDTPQERDTIPCERQVSVVRRRL